MWCAPCPNRKSKETIHLKQWFPETGIIMSVLCEGKFQWKMEQNYCLSYSYLLTVKLVKRTKDKDGNAIKWLQIKWLRYKEFGVVEFKYSLDHVFHLTLWTWGEKREEERQLSISPKLIQGEHLSDKRIKMTSLLPLINPECHHFYQSLPTNHYASDNIVPDSDSS